jgi:putative ABC transport system permease protein
MKDVAYALRILRKNPAFAATAILTLAIGIGGNAAIFTVVRSVLLKPLEYRDPDQLIYFNISNPQFAEETPFSLDQMESIRKGARSFTGIGAFLASSESMTLSGAGEPESLHAARVSANFLDILGIQPLLGRGLIAQEDERGGPSVAILSERLWRRRFNSDPSIIGRTITLEATPHTVVGVMPNGFEFPLIASDVWLPRPSEWSRFAGTRYFRTGFLTGFARMKPGVTLAQASAEMDVLSQNYAAAHPDLKNRSIHVELLKDRLVSNVRTMLWTLFGAVGFVLLIACANVASLMLARATSRSREFAVRAALGAPRGRIIKQLLAESLVLSISGGAIGVWLASFALRAVTLAGALSRQTSVRPLSIPGGGELHVDAAVLAFSILLAVATGVLFGLFPSLEASRPNLADVLRESGAAKSSGRRRMLGLTPRGLLLIGQVALSIVLLIGAGLLIRSFARLRGVDPGFQPAGVLTMKIALPPARYNTDQKKYAFFNELASRAQSVPGVRAATVAMSLPATTIIRTNLTIAGRPEADYNEPLNFGVVEAVTPGYFQTLGIALRRGRDFTDRDNAPGAPPVMIINEHIARRFWPDYPGGIDPVGQRIGDGFDKAVGWFEVIGVVADTHELGLGADAENEFYIPVALHPPQTAYLAARTEGDPRGFVNALREQVWSIDANQSVADVKTMEAMLESTLGPRRVTMLLLASFAGVALLLAMTGIYGVIAYSVAQRTQEVGIRRALGAQQGDIIRLVLGQALGLTSAGIAIGIVAAIGMTRVMSGLLFHLSPTDPVTFALIAILFLAVAMTAAYLPARRAARIDPMAALR